MSSNRASRLPFVALLLIPLLVAPAAGAEGDAGSETDAGDEVSITLPIGEVVPEVVTLHDPEQRYSLFLPPGYDPKERWLVLFVLDPRGRAVPAMELFVAGAAEHGWIVLSSGSIEPSRPSKPPSGSAATTSKDSAPNPSGSPSARTLAGVGWWGRGLGRQDLSGSSCQR